MAGGAAAYAVGTGIDAGKKLAPMAGQAARWGAMKAAALFTGGGSTAVATGASAAASAAALKPPPKGEGK